MNTSVIYATAAECFRNRKTILMVTVSVMLRRAGAVRRMRRPVMPLRRACAMLGVFDTRIVSVAQLYRLPGTRIKAPKAVDRGLLRGDACIRQCPDTENLLYYKALTAYSQAAHGAKALDEAQASAEGSRCCSRERRSMPHMCCLVPIQLKRGFRKSFDGVSGNFMKIMCANFGNDEEG